MIKPYKQIRDAWASTAFEDRSIRVSSWLHYANVESPIEMIMGEALAVIHAVAMENYGGSDWLTQLTTPDEFSIMDDEGLFQISPQVRVGPYRVDFAIRCYACPSIKLAVECDGHDFHEKTKQQAAHDKKRDREIQREGFDIVRFTGSEIWNDPVGCVVEVFAHFASKFPDDGWVALHNKAEELWIGR